MLVYTLPETIMYVSGGHGPLDDHLPLQIRVDDILPGDPGSQALHGTAIYACRPRQTPSQPPQAVSRQSYGCPMEYLGVDVLHHSYFPAR